MNYEKMINELIEANQLKMDMPKNEKAREELLRSLMTISNPTKLSDSYYTEEAKYLSHKKDEMDLVSIEDIKEKLMDNIYIYKGDITGVRADAIVNAANSKLLGCFIPGHRCIDNAIHMAAGLQLRNACHELMVAQGHDEAVGKAKITEGYHLPSKYVVHTVGPNMNGPVEMTLDQMRPQLASCYSSTLDAVNIYADIQNVVFCSISTGVFGVDIRIGSEIALKTIREYLNTHDHHLKKIVINVFSQEDYHVYKETANRLMGG